MGRATDELLKTHRVVEQILSHFNTIRPPFSDVRATLERAVTAHCWLQDEFLLPVLWGKPLIVRQFLVEVTQEHHDLESLLERLQTIAPDAAREDEALVFQIRALLETHFAKEKNALYPLIEQVVDDPTLRRLGEEMEKRKTEVRAAVRQGPVPDQSVRGTDGNSRNISKIDHASGLSGLPTMAGQK
jgi:iron-sulfur cluster repair protein YtfE (RIC family)